MASQQELLTPWREYFDTALSSVGLRPPLPRADETSNAYAARTLNVLSSRHLPQNHEYYPINYRKLEPDALEQFAPLVVEAVKVETVNPAHLKPDEIKMIVKRDINGVEKRDWVGRHSFVRDMMRPGRRVLSFTTDRGRYDAAKSRWF